jgi:hypothetical protein
MSRQTTLDEYPKKRMSIQYLCIETVIDLLTPPNSPPTDHELYEPPTQPNTPPVSPSLFMLEPTTIPTSVLAGMDATVVEPEPEQPKKKRARSTKRLTPKKKPKKQKVIEDIVEKVVEEFGRGKRKRTMNKKYKEFVQ